MPVRSSPSACLPHSSSTCWFLSRKLAMGHFGLIVFWILGTAVLGYVRSQELATEAPTGGQPWALCPANDSPAATQEEQLPVQPRFSSCMLRCTSHAYEAYTAMLASGDFKSMTTSLKLNEGRQGEREGRGMGARLRLDASCATNQTQAGDGLWRLRPGALTAVKQLSGRSQGFEFLGEGCL